MNIDTKWLEDFLMLAEVQHFSRAAEARHITQPAFGRHIRALEKAVGQNLIDRSTTPISLTPAGRQFRNIARNMITQMEEGLRLINGTEQPLVNPIRIATPHSLSSPTLLDLIEHSDKEHDLTYAIDILRVDFAVESLTEGNCDFFLGFEILSLLQPPFQSLCIGHGHFLLVSASDNNGQALFQPNSERTPIIRYSAESYSARLIEQHQPDLPQLNTYPVFETSMCQLHKEMAIRGKGIAWLPDSQIQQALKDKTLVAIEPDVYRLPYQVRLYRNSAPLRKEAEALWLALSKQVQSGWQIHLPWQQ
ncbi:LysR family transcriptional regulator [Photobacterium sanctipauli]|uniref:LysR family transcriptional regulator n=1 Tax=Photobacterium sanctipauli TaxID=1342794 RepID=A0A2T3NUG9_9GAMM|nr:LysR family transcriptional regulator [Photobacterium sanctipauli]PSW19924.1 LysR family transcriptional regulator [Photobacterium sanctipauli]